MKYKRVGVLMGGPSCEREISILSGKAVYEAFRRRKIEAYPIELEPSHSLDGYREIVKDKIFKSGIDVAFIALHGKFGEDGTIQELLETMNIPYTGSRVLASRYGMDKVTSKEFFRLNGISCARYSVVKKEIDCIDKDTLEGYFKDLGPSVVVKPSNQGSSIGLSIASSMIELEQAILEAFKYSDVLIIERYLEGREITVGVLEDKPLPIVEIVPKRKFFDYKAKYEKGMTSYIVPAKIKEREYLSAQRLALRAHKALGVHFFSRVDMIMDRDGFSFVLEVNTIPGLTQRSLLPKAARAAGIPFDELCIRILESAFVKVERDVKRVRIW